MNSNGKSTVKKIKTKGGENEGERMRRGRKRRKRR